MSRDRISKLGGEARARKLSAKRRKQIAREAAHARWARRKLDFLPDAYVYVGPSAVYTKPVEAPNA